MLDRLDAFQAAVARGGFGNVKLEDITSLANHLIGKGLIGHARRDAVPPSPPRRWNRDEMGAAGGDLMSGLA